MHREFYQLIKILDPQQQIKLLSAICEYALDGINPELEYPLDGYWILIKEQIDINTERMANRQKLIDAKNKKS